MRWIIFISLVLLSCEKSEDRSCWKFTGDSTTKEIELGEFDRLFLGPHLKFILVQDTVNKVVLKGGENVVNFIMTDIDNGQLRMTDENKCNFLREESKKVEVTLHYKKIINIEFEGTEEVTCTNTMNSDYLTVTLRDGAGKFSLNVNAIALFANVTHGWGNFYLAGNVNYFNLNVKNNGFGNAYDLHVADSLHAISRSTEGIKVNADGCEFKCQTHSSGDIWYIGTPTSLEFNKYGSGDLIDKN